MLLSWNWNISVSIPNRLEGEQPKNQGSVGTRGFLIQRDQTGSGAHPTPYPSDY
jgi:hypothetical protein